MTDDPNNSDYNAKVRDEIANLAPWYCPNNKRYIVRGSVFEKFLNELRSRERILLDAMIPFLEVAKSIDSDSMCSTLPNDAVLFRFSGSWGPEKEITIGDFKRLLESTKKYEK